MEKSVILEAGHISKNFRDPVTVPVLKDISFTIDKGEFVSITGKSGCGKSTLLYILSTMDTDYEGDVIIGGEHMKGKRESELARVRNEKIGFVFQFHYLLNEFSVLENVMLPALKLSRLRETQIRSNAMDRLHMLGIDSLANKVAGQLSGGEKQRVAIARALVNDPFIIMCDEPTGNLDKVNSQLVLSIFKQLAAEHHQTLLVVTHDLEFASQTQRTITMEDGKIIRNIASQSSKLPVS